MPINRELSQFGSFVEVANSTKLGIVNPNVGIGTTNPTVKVEVHGSAKITGSIDCDTDLDVDGHTELDTVNVSAGATFAGGVTFNSSTITANAGLVANTAKVTDLTDNRVVIAGNAGELEDDARLTFNGTNLTVGLGSGFTVSKDGDLTLTGVSTTSSAGPELKLYRNSPSPFDADYIGQIKFTGKQDGGGTVNYAKITGKILDASSGTEDGILEFMLRKGGSNNIAARFRSDSLQLLNGTGLTVAGNISVDDSSGSTNGRIILGTGDDLQIYHDATNSHIQNTTGSFFIDQTVDDNDLNFRCDNGSGGLTTYIQADGSTGKVKLFDYGSLKLETTTTGVTVTGSLTQTTEYPSIRPTLDLNFAATKTLDRRITFKRNSIGTFTDELGIVRYATNNVPRFDHDPTTGESLGLLIEESRTNDFAHSDAATSVWLSDGGIIKTANTTDTKAPDGSFTATKLASEATANSYSQIFDTLSKSSGGVQSFWAKKGTHNVIGIYYYSGSNGIAGWFDLNTGEHRCEGGSKVAAGVQSNGNGNNNTNMIEYPNGWYRCIYYENSNMTYSHIRIVDFDSDNEASSSSNTIYIWGLQAEVNKTFATSFIPSLSSTMPATNSTRSQDTAKIDGTNFTDFYNQEEGTLVAHYYSTVDDGMIAMLESVTTPADDRIGFVNYAGYQGYVETGNATQASLDNGTPTVGAVNKVAYAFKANDFALSLNSATPTTDTSGTMPTVGRMMIGSRFGGQYDILKSSIRRLSYYPKRLPNAQLQGLTQQ